MIHGRRVPFYRSIIVRYSFILSGSFLAWSLSSWGPRPWRSTPSLRWLHQVLPWPLMSAGFAVYVCLLVWGSVKSSAVADWLGLFMYGCAFIAAVVTVRFDRPTNPIGIGALFLVCVLHYAAARLAEIQGATSSTEGA